jgi:hypothetical protein
MHSTVNRIQFLKQNPPDADRLNILQIILSLEKYRGILMIGLVHQLISYDALKRSSFEIRGGIKKRA